MDKRVISWREMGEGKEKEKSTAHGDADVGDLRQETNGAQTLKPNPKLQGTVQRGATRPDCAMTSRLAIGCIAPRGSSHVGLIEPSCCANIQPCT